MPSRSSASDPSQVRILARKARSQISPTDREEKSIAIAGQLAHYQPFREATHIGVYFSTVEEVDTAPLMALCVEQQKNLYLPIIQSGGTGNDSMMFHRYIPGASKTRKNKFGIPEPVIQPGELIAGSSLELVVVPTVAFNRNCDRIGMGGGYYDRTFGSSGLAASRKVTLVGLAFDCQQATFNAQPHDVALDAIITESATVTR